jgi:hypothetical protein
MKMQAFEREYLTMPGQPFRGAYYLGFNRWPRWELLHCSIDRVCSESHVTDKLRGQGTLHPPYGEGTKYAEDACSP